MKSVSLATGRETFAMGPTPDRAAGSSQIITYPLQQEHFRMMFRRVLLITLLLTCRAAAEQPPTTDSKKWWGSAVDTALNTSGEKRSEWEDALDRVKPEQRVALEFLLSHMPTRDLQSLSGQRLVSEIELAYRARATVPWGNQIPEAVFLNDVLPYANIDEPRDPWREDFYAKFIDRVRTCDSPGEAALLLNATVFGSLNVKYSTVRKRANQSPRESIEQGLASCTGLSIILADVCRAVCIPARLTGIAEWPNKGGNHTWVEIWDGDWHFVGAAEPDPAGLDRGWFIADAARARKDAPNIPFSPSVSNQPTLGGPWSGKMRRARYRRSM